MFLLNSLKFFSLHFTINRKNKALCQKKSRIYQTCNTQVRPKSSIHEYSYAIPLNRQYKLFRQTAWLVHGPADTCRQSLSDWYTTSKDRIYMENLDCCLMCWRKYITPHYSSHSLAPKKARISVIYSVHRTTEEIYLSMAKEQNGSHIVEVIVINVIIDQPFKGSFFFFVNSLKYVE